MVTPLKSGTLIPSKAPNLPIAPVDYDQRYIDQLTNALRLYFTEIDNLAQFISNPLYGTTANRPISTIVLPVPIGQTYFDTTLGKPIWWNGTNWVNASGTIV